MKTAGYDLVVLLNEKFLNQATGALFYTGFLKINGLFRLQDELDANTLSKIPKDLQRFMEIKYRLKLNFEPSIDFIEPTPGNMDPQIRIHAALRTYFWLWDGLELKFDTQLSLVADIAIEGHEFVVDIAKARVEQLEIKYNYDMTHAVTLKLDGIVSKAVEVYLQKAEKQFRLTLPSLTSNLPNVVSQLPIYLKTIKVIDSTTMAVAFNFVNFNGGDPNQLQNFARNCSAAVGASEEGMYKVYDFFWDHFPFSKTFKFSTSFTNDTVNEIINILGGIANVIQRVAVELATLGFVETNIELKGMRFEVGANVHLLSKPRFDLLSGNRVKITRLDTNTLFWVKVYLDVEYSVEIDPTGWLPDFIPDIEVCHERTEVKLLDLAIPFNGLNLKEGIGKITLDDATNTLQVKIEKIDLYWDFNKYDNCPILEFPEWLVNKLIDFCEGKICDAIPPIVVTPSFTVNIPYVDWNLNIQGKKVEVTDSEAILAADMYFNELKCDQPYVPKYIVNVHNEEIHKAGCDSILDTYEEHQRGYHLLNDAVNRGYDGCKRCLPAYHHR